MPFCDSGQKTLAGTNPFAAGAGQTGDARCGSDEAAGHLFQIVGHFLANSAQANVTIGAGIGVRRQLHLHPGDMVRSDRWVYPSPRRAVFDAVAISLVSSASCSCSAVPDDAPIPCTRCPAS